MEFVIRDIEGNEHGPVDPETLRKWVEDDRITAKTEVRNALLSSWKTVDKLDFLADLLAEQQKRQLVVEDNFNKTAKAAKKIGSLFKKKQTETGTAFVCKYVPEFAPLGRRTLAFLFDFFLLALVALVLFWHFIGVARTIAARETGSDELRKADILANNAPAWLEENKKAPLAGNNKAVNVGAVAGKGEKAQATAEQGEKPKATAKNVAQTADASSTDKSKADKAADTDALVIATPPRIPEKLPDNLKAISPPTIHADRSNGYYLGSVWQNSSPGGLRYVCIDPSEGAAMWITVSRLRSMVTTVFAILLVVAFLYYGITLGFFAQTFGMWYWGIFIVKKDTSEAYFLRVMVWSILLMMIGIISPLFIYLFRWAPHDILAKVKIIQVAGTPPVG